MPGHPFHYNKHALDMMPVAQNTFNTFIKDPGKWSKEDRQLFIELEEDEEDE